MAPESLLAAVDLGSNSFRLEIGRVGSHQRIERVEYLKETVRQGNGLNAQHELSLDAMTRGWECLARFGERLAGFFSTDLMVKSPARASTCSGYTNPARST